MAAFAAEPILNIGSFPITNTIIHTLFVDALLIGGALTIKKRISLIPNMLQNLTELVFETFYNLIQSIAYDRVRYIFPYFMTFFLFILIANWTGLLPGIGTIGFFKNHGEENFTPLFRGTTSDMNTTFALALISAFATHILSIRLTGIKDYLSRFFSLNPIFLFVGFLELISEITKVISLSFRLFGNIFAGETVLHTISNMFAFLVPLPFLLLEVIVGLVQALVFSMLTFVFMAILTTPHHAPNHDVVKH